MWRANAGCTALHWAANNGHTELVTRLLERIEGDGAAYGEAGPPLLWRTNDGSTALHEAAWKGHFELVQSLICHGADPLAEAKWSTTCIKVCRSSHPEIAAFLDRSVSARSTFIARLEIARESKHSSISAAETAATIAAEFSITAAKSTPAADASDTRVELNMATNVEEIQRRILQSDGEFAEECQLEVENRRFVTPPLLLPARISS